MYSIQIYCCICISQSPPSNEDIAFVCRTIANILYGTESHTELTELRKVQAKIKTNRKLIAQDFSILSVANRWSYFTKIVPIYEKWWFVRIKREENKISKVCDTLTFYEKYWWSSYSQSNNNQLFIQCSSIHFTYCVAISIFRRRIRQINREYSWLKMVRMKNSWRKTVRINTHTHTLTLILTLASLFGSYFDVFQRELFLESPTCTWIDTKIETQSYI